MFTTIFSSLRQHDLTTVDELSRTLEDLPPAIYDQPYYARGDEALYNLLQDKGTVSRANLEQSMAAINTRIEAMECARHWAAAVAHRRPCARALHQSAR